jgi:hypothetical protein
MTRQQDPAMRPLLAGVSQYEVDFVIPRVGVDVPVGIDPFLLFKSRDPEFRILHDKIINVFRSGIDCIKAGHGEDARTIFQFPEVAEIGLGYTRQGKKGSGVGNFLSSLILNTLRDSPMMLDRGVRHIEELQLISMGIGPDRVSDIAASLIKSYLIEYTQKQCATWSILLTRGVPVKHFFDYDTWGWMDGYFDLPISPIDGSAILLVPRRIVRALPWINYDDFVKLEFAVYLRAKGAKSHSRGSDTANAAVAKQNVVAVTRQEIARVSRYIQMKEDSAADAQPSSVFVDTRGFAVEADLLKKRLSGIPAGTEGAAKYQQTVLEILNFLFNPELIDGELEVRTIEGTERRDIIFTNDSDSTFLNYVRQEHSALYLMFETKNTQTIGAAALNQTATYLGDRLGRLGFIVTRFVPEETAMRKAFSIYNDAVPRKIILFLSDQDLFKLLDLKCSGKDTIRQIQKIYRKFRTSVQ